MAHHALQKMFLMIIKWVGKMFDKASPTSMMGQMLPEIPTVSYLWISFVKIQAQNYAVHSLKTFSTGAKANYSKKNTHTRGRGRPNTKGRCCVSIYQYHGKFLNIIFRLYVTSTDSSLSYGSSILWSLFFFKLQWYLLSMHVERKQTKIWADFIVGNYNSGCLHVKTCDIIYFTSH